MTRWSEQELEHFTASRQTAANKKYQKALNQAKHESNKAVEAEARRIIEQGLRDRGIIPPDWEVRFHSERRWRFDGGYPALKIGFEFEGGLHAQGRHNRAAGYAADCEKYNAAALLGWLVFRFTYPMIRDGRATETLYAAVSERSTLSSSYFRGIMPPSKL